MNKTLFTSDLHINHKNLLKYCPETRPFENVAEMNDAMRTMWNETVGEYDHVYILGDVSLGGSKKNVINFLNSLNGLKHLVIGNHDLHLVGRGNNDFTKCFVEVEHYIDRKINGIAFKMFHYPIHNWHHCYRQDVIHLYGHMHGTPLPFLEPYRCMDVSLDANGFKILTVEEIIDKMKDKQVMLHQE